MQNSNTLKKHWLKSFISDSDHFKPHRIFSTDTLKKHEKKVFLFQDQFTPTALSGIFKFIFAIIQYFLHFTVISPAGTLTDEQNLRQLVRRDFTFSRVY